jgi:hypothetical protein
MGYSEHGARAVRRPRERPRRAMRALPGAGAHGSLALMAGYPLKLKKWDPGDRDGCHPHWVQPDGADAPRCRYKIPMVCKPQASANAACLTLLCQGPYPPMQRVRACVSRLVPVRLKIKSGKRLRLRRPATKSHRMSVFSLAAMRTIALRVIVVFSTPSKNMQTPRHLHANARHKHANLRHHEHETPRQYVQSVPKFAIAVTTIGLQRFCSQVDNFIEDSHCKFLT